MNDSFEFRDDPKRAEVAPRCPKQICAVKWEALKACANYVRNQAVGSADGARQLADMLDQVGITPDFEPDDVYPLLPLRGPVINPLGV